MRDTKASMLRRLRYVLLTVFAATFLILFTGLTPFAHAQVTDYSHLNTTSDVPKNQHTMVYTLTNDILSSLNCFVIGMDPMAPNFQCLTFDKKTQLYSYASVDESGGVVGALLTSIPMMYDLPVHTGDYTNYLASNFGVTRPAYAQPAKAGSVGTGFEQLAPLLPFWAAMRNLVYLLYVIAFVVIGAGIMLRLKMDPRTVMSIQNQIPKVIISIILVTFSYAIAGLMIDAMYVTIYSVYGIAGRIDVFNKDDDGRQNFLRTQDDIFGQNPLDFANNVFSITGISGSAGFEGSRIIGGLLIPREWAGTTSDDTFILGGLKTILSVAVGDVLNVVKAVLASIATLVAVAILPLIVGVAIIVSLIKLWFTLIKAYIIIIINIVLAPFWIFLGVFPGSKVNFESWIRQLAAYLLVFPAVILLFLFAKLLSVAFAQGASTYFAPPLIGTLSGPENLSNLVAFGVILIGPILLDQIIVIMKAPTAGAISKAVISGAQEGRQWTRKGTDKIVGAGKQALTYRASGLNFGDAPGPGQSEGVLRTFGRNYLDPTTPTAGNMGASWADAQRTRRASRTSFPVTAIRAGTSFVAEKVFGAKKT